MLFNKKTRQAFTFPMKTGTLTTKNFLEKLGWHNGGELHVPIVDLLKEYPNLINYEVYSFLRNPLRRFESCVLYMKQNSYYSSVFGTFLRTFKINRTIEDISYDEIVDLFLNLKCWINTPLENEFIFYGKKGEQTFKLLFSPQALWVDHPKVTALDFDNFECELRHVTGDRDTPIVPHNVSTVFGKSVITNKVKDFVRQEYADDYNFAKKVFGKEYLQ